LFTPVLQSADGWAPVQTTVWAQQRGAPDEPPQGGLRVHLTLGAIDQKGSTGGAVAAGVLEGVKGFRRLKGHADMPKLGAALRARDRRLGLTVSAENVA
jgi:hypothetical protein